MTLPYMNTLYETFKLSQVKCVCCQKEAEILRLQEMLNLDYQI